MQIASLVHHKQKEPGCRGILTLWLVLALMVSLVACSKTANKASVSTTVQKTFDSPAAAGSALFETANSGDSNKLMDIFGPEGKDFLFSGDPVQDANARQRFIDAYTQMHRWSAQKSGDEILYIGADNFPFPIPLSKNSAGRWAFNTAAGKDEVLARRIGHGELTAIGVLTEIANAEQEYFSRYHQFAGKFVSDEDQHNGLYWPVSEGERPSPLGHLAEEAKALGYSHSDRPQPFNGYYYKILTEQGEASGDGAKDYLVDGKLVRGFAIVAWPASYRDSGIMTFIVGQNGTIYQRDLGENTNQTVAAMTAYDPNSTWAVVLSPDASAVASNRR